MKTATRPRAGPARTLALPLLAILFLGTIASPALGAPDGPDGTTELTTAAAGGNSCPQGDGWTKVDDIEGGSGSVTGDPDTDLGDFGTLSWDGDTVSWTLEDDYVLDLCIKSGAQSGALDPTEHLGLTGTGSVTTTGPGEDGQDLSHLSYRITYVVPPPPPPVDGSVTVAKAVTGDGDAPEGDFTFVIRDSDQQVLTTFDLAAGATSTPYDVPADTTLTIEETVDHDADATTWTTNGTSGTGTTTDTLTIGEDQHVTITFTNRFDAEPPPPPPPPVDGSVTVVKAVTGDGDAPEGDFTFVIRDSDQQVLTTFDLADGATSTPYDVPADTTLTIEETIDHDADATTWTTNGTSGTGTTTDTLTIGEDQHVTITFTNDYDADEQPETEVESEVIESEEEDQAPAEVEAEEEAEVEVLAEVLEREALPRTGTDGTRLVFLGGLLLLIGTALLRRPAPVRR